MFIGANALFNEDGSLLNGGAQVVSEVSLEHLEQWVNGDGPSVFAVTSMFTPNIPAGPDRSELE
jgi:hypothetical protein